MAEHGHQHGPGCSHGDDGHHAEHEHHGHSHGADGACGGHHEEHEHHGHSHGADGACGGHDDDDHHHHGHSHGPDGQCGGDEHDGDWEDEEEEEGGHHGHSHGPDGKCGGGHQHGHQHGHGGHGHQHGPNCRHERAPRPVPRSEEISPEQKQAWVSKGNAAWANAGDVTARTAQRTSDDRAGMLSVRESTPPHLELENMFFNTRRWWLKNRCRFVEVWPALEAGTRLNLVKSLAPHTPPDPDHNSLYARITPEISLKYAVHENDGIMMCRVFDHLLNCDDVVELFAQHVQAGSQGIAVPKGNAALVNWQEFFRKGSGIFTVSSKMPPATLKRIEELKSQYMLLPQPVFQACITALHAKLQLLSNLVAEFRTQLFGKENGNTNVSIGCWKCHAPTRPDGSDLLACAVCRTAVYCSADCQKIHWKEHHKKSCAKKA